MDVKTLSGVVEIPCRAVREYIDPTGPRTKPWGEPFYLNLPYIERRGFNSDSMMFFQLPDYSMQNRARQGDIVFIDSSDTTPRDGEMYLLQHKGGAKVRWIFVNQDGSLTLAPDAPLQRYTVETVGASLVKSLKIVGRVVYISGMPT